MTSLIAWFLSLRGFGNKRFDLEVYKVGRAQRGFKGAAWGGHGLKFIFETLVAVRL